MSNATLSRSRMEAKTRRQQRIENVYDIPTTDESKVLWFVQESSKVLLCREYGGAGVCPVDTVLRRSSDDVIHMAMLVAIGVGICSDDACSGENNKVVDCYASSSWYSVVTIHGCRVDFMGHLLNHGGLVDSRILLYILDLLEEETANVMCMALLHSAARRGIGDWEGVVHHVAYAFHRVSLWLIQHDLTHAGDDSQQKQKLEQRILECISVLDAFLLSVPVEHVETINAENDFGRLYDWIQSCLAIDASNGAPLYQLRARLLLVVSGGNVSPEMYRGDPVVRHMCGGTDDDVHLLSDIDSLIDTIVHWKPTHVSTALSKRIHSKTVAHVAWLVCSTVFLSVPPLIHTANPLSFAKILQNVLLREQPSSRIHSMICWVLASNIHSPMEQRCIVEWEHIPQFERTTMVTRGGCVECVYTWVERQMLSIENKISIDDTSISGSIIGEDESDSLRTIREMVFPCALFCPYRTLHTVFAISTSHRNDAWLLVSLCTVFPHLVYLEPLHCIEKTKGLVYSTELARLLLEGILTMSGDGMSSYLPALRLLVSQGPQDHCIPLLVNDFCESFVALLSGPDESSLELATECMKHVCFACQASIDTQQAASVISTCLHHLEFHTRYQRRVPLKKTVLQNIQEIMEYNIHLLVDPGERQCILSDMEHQGAHPWARLYFGFEFSSSDAHYILHINPKLDEPNLLQHDVYRVGNVRMHQTLELAALGSVHINELSSLPSGYSTMESFRNDLMGSIQCLYSVCTSAEIMHLMTSLEIVCSSLFVQSLDRQHDLKLAMSSSKVVSLSSKAMVIELCIQSVLTFNSSSLHHTIADICQYVMFCNIQSTKDRDTLDWIFIVRVFSECVKCYAALVVVLHTKSSDDPQMMSIRDACTSVESVISSLCAWARDTPGMHCSLMASAIKDHVGLPEEEHHASIMMHAIYSSLVNE